MCLLLALAISIPVAFIASVASKVYELQIDDEALLREEKWKARDSTRLDSTRRDATRLGLRRAHVSTARSSTSSITMHTSSNTHQSSPSTSSHHDATRQMTIDGVDDWRRHAALADLAETIKRRDAHAFPRVLGVRCGRGCANAACALTFGIFVLLMGVIAIETTGGVYAGTSNDQARDFTRRQTTLRRLPFPPRRAARDSTLCYYCTLSLRLTSRHPRRRRSSNR